MKKCMRCEQEKTLDSFSKDKSRSDGKSLYCRECTKSYRDARRAKLGGHEDTIKYRENAEFRERMKTEKREKYRQDADYREATKARSYARITERSQQYRDWTYSLKTPCIICGEADPAVIDFHHIDPDTKSFTIGNGNNHSRAKEQIINEVKKCVCLCANDHRRLHLGLIDLPQEYLKD